MSWRTTQRSFRDSITRSSTSCSATATTPSQAQGTRPDKRQTSAQRSSGLKLLPSRGDGLNNLSLSAGRGTIGHIRRDPACSAELAGTIKASPARWTMQSGIPSLSRIQQDTSSARARFTSQTKILIQRYSIDQHDPEVRIMLPDWPRPMAGPKARFSHWKRWLLGRAGAEGPAQ